MKKSVGICSAGVIAVAIALFTFNSERPVLPGGDIETVSNGANSVILSSDSYAESLQLTLPYKDIRTIGEGDTMMALLTDAGVRATEADHAIRAMAKIYKPRQIKPGQRISLTMQPQPLKAPALKLLTFSASIERDIAVRRTANGFQAETILRPLQRHEIRASGRINTSLYAAGVHAGLSLSTLSKLIHVFSFDVDFQRDIRHGDSFALLFEEYIDASNRTVKAGNILVAEMVLSGDLLRVYRYETKDGQVDYYDIKGQSVRKALLRTPIDGARISSGFGKRRHPILGYTRMHKGLDFAARRGTPIFAAGDGIVEYAGRNGGYGKYLRIRHNSTYKTAYAHMHRYARGVRKGRRVSQGQVIGYVGSTGRSTGPHLHYEVHRAGRQVNPRTIELPSGRKLKGKELTAFKTYAGKIESRYANIAPPQQVAHRQN